MTVNSPAVSTDVASPQAALPPGEESPGPFWRALHMGTLAVFGIASPLLGELGQRDRFLIDNGITWAGILQLLVVLILLLPTAVAAVDWIVGRVAAGLDRIGLPRWTVGWLQGVVPTALLLLLTLRLTQIPIRLKWIWHTEANVNDMIATATVIAIVGAWLYGRSVLLRRWCTVLSLAALIFPVTFLLQFASLRRAAPAAGPSAPDTPIDNPVPIVFIVFDEFSGTTLMDEQRTIDAERFPQFARLAEMSTWYRNATTVHERTNLVLPAILTGRYPAEDRIDSTPAHYPNNLFTWLGGTRQYEAIVFEPVSRLCEPKLFGETERPASGQLRCLTETLSCVLPHFLLMQSNLYELPEIPRSWFGFAEPDRVNREDRRGVVRYSWDFEHGVQANHFLDCLTPGEQPLLAFFHWVCPHSPWAYLPTGHHYAGPFDNAPDDEVWPDTPQASRQAWQRYALQVGYVDRTLGRILDRLEEQGMLDECLLVVMSDHGVSFRPGLSRRQGMGESLPEILSVPLFVKLPGQRSGKVSDRNVQSIDILPTVAEVVHAPLPGPLDGESILDETRPAPLRKRAWLAGKDTVLEPVLSGTKRVIEERIALLGKGEMSTALRDIGPHPEWQGKPLPGPILPSEEGPQETGRAAGGLDVTLHPIGADTSREAGDFVPAFLKGTISGHRKGATREERQRELVWVVNGVVGGTTWSYPYNDAERWELMLPESVARAPGGPVELFEIETRPGGGFEFRKLLSIQELPRPWSADSPPAT